MKKIIIIICTVALIVLLSVILYDIFQHEGIYKPLFKEKP